MAITTFISTWDTTKTSHDSSEWDQIKLPLVSGGTYDFIVNWGDGNSSTITSWNQIDTLHSYSSVGLHTIEIDGLINGWSFYNQADCRKITSISQWGNLLIGNDGHQFDGCNNMSCNTLDSLSITGVTNMSYMFSDCFAFNYDISHWSVDSVTNMSYMFNNCFTFNQDLSNWNVSKVTDMSGMFNGCNIFTSNLSNWDVSKVTDMSYMFSDCFAFNQNVSNWDVSKVTSMSYMFFNATIFNQDLSNWNITGVTNMDYIIYLNTAFSTANYDNLLNSWSLQNVRPNVLFGVYQTQYTASAARDILTSAPNNWIISDGGLYSATTTTTTTTIMPLGSFVSTWVTSRGINASSNSIKLPLVSGGNYNFYVNWGDGSGNAITSWDQSDTNHIYASGGTYVVIINGLINGWKFVNDNTDILKIDNIDQWGCLQFGNGGGMWGCVDLKCTATDSPNLSGITNMSGMFGNCYFLTMDASNWDVSNATNMSNMFYGCHSFNSDLSLWNVSNVTDMGGMFLSCSNFNSDLSLWNVSGVTDTNNMFYQCSLFNSDLSQWNVSNVADMNNMFNQCTLFASDLSKWDVSNVTRMYLMFYRCTNFNSNLSGWNISKVIDMGEMYDYANLSSSNYSDMLIAWAEQPIQPNVSLGANSSYYYSSAVPARLLLTGSPNNWIISDAGLLESPVKMIKKIQSKIFTERDPLSSDNISAGFSLGQIWHNTITNKEFVHESDEVWQLISYIINNSFAGIYVLTQAEYNALSSVDINTVYIIKN